MKLNIYIKTALVVAAAGTMTSCNDFLDQEPQYAVTRQVFYQ